MNNLETDYAEDARLRLTAVVYGAVVLAALLIGLYGFFSLLWLAGSAVERAGQTPGLLG